MDLLRWIDLMLGCSRRFLPALDSDSLNLGLSLCLLVWVIDLNLIENLPLPAAQLNACHLLINQLVLDSVIRYKKARLVVTHVLLVELLVLPPDGLDVPMLVVFDLNTVE